MDVDNDEEDRRVRIANIPPWSWFNLTATQVANTRWEKASFGSVRDGGSQIAGEALLARTRVPEANGSRVFVSEMYGLDQKTRCSRERKERARLILLGLIVIIYRRFLVFKTTTVHIKSIKKEEFVS